MNQIKVISLLITFLNNLRRLKVPQTYNGWPVTPTSLNEQTLGCSGYGWKMVAGDCCKQMVPLRLVATMQWPNPDRNRGWRCYRKEGRSAELINLSGPGGQGFEPLPFQNGRLLQPRRVSACSSPGTSPSSQTKPEVRREVRSSEPRRSVWRLPCSLYP